MPDLLPWICCVFAFLLGAVPFGFLAGKLRGVDLREHGSGNIGATNTLRVLGKTAGITVLFLDAFKGYLPVMLALRAGLSSTWVVAAGLCAVLGHIYSPFVRFRGGKGVATGLGVLIGMDALIAGYALLAFFVGFLLSGRRVSVGSLLGAIAQAVLFWILPPERPLAMKLFATLVALFIVARHRENLRRLMRGEEKPLQMR